MLDLVIYIQIYFLMYVEHRADFLSLLVIYVLLYNYLLTYCSNWY